MGSVLADIKPRDRMVDSETSEAEAEQLQSLIYFLILFHAFIQKLLFCARPVLVFEGTEMNQIYSLFSRYSGSGGGHGPPEISTLASKSPCTSSTCCALHKSGGALFT